MFKNNKYPKTLLLSAAIGSVGLGLSFQASADQYSDAAKKWVNESFKKSTLSKEEQMKEMEWFRIMTRPGKKVGRSICRGFSSFSSPRFSKTFDLLLG